MEARGSAELQAEDGKVLGGGGNQQAELWQGLPDEHNVVGCPHAGLHAQCGAAGGIWRPVLGLSGRL